jgi:phenylalanyl-tRNA synthetase alpha chain
LQSLFGRLKEVAPENRKEMGLVLNNLKNTAEEIFASAKARIEAAAEANIPTSALDLTLPAPANALGTRHILSIVRDEMLAVFRQIGFAVAEGPEIEDDWHNFTALNFPPDHPAREMQDTFFIRRSAEEGDIVLRTHTSPVQIRVMQDRKPPIRCLMPGRVYRNEAISARAHCLFHQIEGLYVDKNVSFVDLKETLYYFVQTYFNPGTNIRFRPSFFPFTEPSAEIDISCQICGGSGCNICKHTGWVEIGGSGMVHPNVLRNAGIDPDEYTGFAFGMGVERTAMLKYQIKDLRLFTENDVRFLRQFASI